MADRSPIEWTDASWTPIRARNRGTGKVGWHCEHASPGCLHCYSETFNEVRLGTGLPFKPGHRVDVEHFLDESMLLVPLRWRRPRKIFVCSMTDLFGDWVPDEWIDRVFAVMALCPQHTFQVLTKRSARMRAYLQSGRATPVGMEAMDITLHAHAADPRSMVGAGVKLKGDIAHLAVWPLPNVWLGVSCEDQRRADERVPDLLATPAAVRFVSAEPLLGATNYSRWLPGSYECGASCGWRSAIAPQREICHACGLTSECFGEFCECGSQDFGAICPSCESDAVVDHPDTPHIDLIVVGGESGLGARVWDGFEDAARSICDQCARAGVAFFMKQMAGPRKSAMPPIPADLLVRQMPVIQGGRDGV